MNREELSHDLHDLHDNPKSKPSEFCNEFCNHCPLCVLPEEYEILKNKLEIAMIVLEKIWDNSNEENIIKVAEDAIHLIEAVGKDEK